MDAHLDFKRVKAVASEFLRVVLSLGIDSLGCVLDLYNVLSSRYCLYCEDFGGFMYLLLGSRACFLCSTEIRELLPMLQSHAQMNMVRLERSV